MLTKNKDNPRYVVKSPESKFYGYTLAEIEKARDEILERRKGKTKKAKSSLFPESKKDGDEETDPFEQEGSGAVDANALVDRLYISLGSIKAGNTSTKLRKQVKQLLHALVMQKVLTQKKSEKNLQTYSIR